MKRQVIKMFESSGLVFTQKEMESIEFADFGLNNFEKEGLSLIVYENNERYCAKEMVLLPNQTCPEHRHPPVSNNIGKQETFRCRQGIVYLYVKGEQTEPIIARIPTENKQYYTAFKQIVLQPGEQYTIAPNCPHWFQSGDDGAIISEFSSMSSDEYDIFTNPQVVR